MHLSSALVVRTGRLYSSWLRSNQCVALVTPMGLSSRRGLTICRPSGLFVTFGMWALPVGKASLADIAHQVRVDFGCG